MIGKGNTHCNGAKLADYLMKGGPDEHAVLLGMRGFASSDLEKEFDHIDKIRDAATAADAALFHVQIRGAEGEGKKLTDAQWLEIADGCDLALGRAMTQQPRAATLHVDANGDRHLHLGYSLLRQTDDGRFYVQKLGLYERKLQLYAREIEQKYGLQILSNEPRPGARRADRNELEESRRLGTDVHAIRTAILDSFQKSDNGQSFAAAMKSQGMAIAAGDRRDCFVVIDPAGGHHALNKKLTGLTLKEIDARLSDLDRTQLPSVDQAKQMQRAAREGQERGEHARATDRPASENARADGPQRSPQPEIKPLGQTAGEIRLAWQLTKTGEQFAQAIEDRGLILVYVSREEAAKSYRAREFAKAIKQQNRALKEGFAVVDRRGTVTKIDQRTTGDLWEEIQKKLGGIDQRELLTVDQAREAMKEARQAEWAAKKRIELDRARPATKLEAAIIAADKKAGRDDHLFAAELGEQGIRLARVTAADVKALDELRQQQDIALAAATEPDNQVSRIGIFAPVQEGEICVVTKLGDVIPLNSQRMADLEYRIFPASSGINPSHAIVASSGDPKSIVAELPGVTDARYEFSVSADLLQEFWRANTEGRAVDRQDALDRRTMRSETKEAITLQNTAVHRLQEVKQDTYAVAQDAVDIAFRAGPRLLHALGAALDYAADFIAPPPPPTAAQIRQMELAAAQQAEIEARIIRPAQEQAQRFGGIGDEARAKIHQREQDSDRERERQREL
jgi:hypothetical protein